MKKRNLLVFVSAAALVLFSSFMVLYPGGAPSPYYYTGSPGDGHSCASCHGSASSVNGWITSNIPAAGYIPGTAYQITASNSVSGSGKYGFEVSPQTTSGTLLGTLTAGTNSKVVGSGKWVTQSTASNNVTSWTFTWTAPAAGTGSVTFYGSFTRSTGSATKLSTLTVSEQAGGSLPAAAGPISGPSAVCKNNTGSFSIGTIAGATSYVWSVPSGSTITSGQGTTSISVNFGTSSVSGNVSVYGSNVAGNGSASNLPVTVNSVPAQPSAITGSDNACQGSNQTYSVTNVSGVTYTWSLPDGSTITAGQGTNSITATIGTSNGNMNVVPSNNCGGGIEQIKAITIQLLPGIPGAVAGPDVVDLAFVATSDYATSAASDATSYQWDLSPADAGTIIGSGITVNVNWNASYLGDAQVRVKAMNDCGEGAWSVIKSTQVINTTGIGDAGSPSVGMKVFPSPSSGAFTVSLNGMSEKVKLKILDATGHELYIIYIPGKEATKLDYPLAPGIYLLLVEDGTTTLKQKLIIR
jgi:hypothetical protein